MSKIFHEKMRDEKLVMFLLKHGCLELTLKKPTEGDAVCYFKDNRLFYSTKIASTLNNEIKVLYISHDEIALCGFTKPVLKDIDCLEHDFVVFVKPYKPNPSNEKMMKKFLKIFEKDNDDKELEYWNDVDLYNKIEPYKVKLWAKKEDLKTTEEDKIIKMKQDLGVLKLELETIKNAFDIELEIIKDALSFLEKGETIEHRRAGKTIDYLKLDTKGVLERLPKIKELAWESKRVFIKDIDIDDTNLA
jgi:hypothetical protein